MKKIKFNSGNMKSLTECFICEHKIPDKIIYEDNKFVSFLDPFPPVMGYTILAVKKHVEDITELNEKEFLEFQKLLYKHVKAIKFGLNAKKVCLKQTGGLLPHLHFHIIPIYDIKRSTIHDILNRKYIYKFTKIEKNNIVNKIKSKL